MTCVHDYFERHGRDGHCALVRTPRGEDALFIEEGANGHLYIGDQNHTPAVDMSDTDVVENVTDWCVAVGLDSEDVGWTLYPHGEP